MTCHEHGHYCPICEEREMELKMWRDIKSEIESWSWNYSIFDIYDELKEKDYSEQERYFAMYQHMHGNSKSDLTSESVKQMQNLACHLLGYDSYDVQIPDGV